MLALTYGTLYYIKILTEATTGGCKMSWILTVAEKFLSQLLTCKIKEIFKTSALTLVKGDKLDT
jgi:hypothetical protein